MIPGDAQMIMKFIDGTKKKLRPSEELIIYQIKKAIDLHLPISENSSHSLCDIYARVTGGGTHQNRQRI